MKVRQNIARGKGQAEAQARCGYGPITIRRQGEYAIVEIECHGVMYEVCREALDSNFCDTVYPLGILEVIERGKRVAA
jgi:hypothetical protein